MTATLKNDVGPEDFGISTMDAEKARHYAAFLVAAERERCAQVCEQEIRACGWDDDVLADMERRKVEHDAAMADAARFRWLDEVALIVDNLVQVWHSYVTPDKPPTTGRTLREAVDEAMKRHNDRIQPGAVATRLE